MSKFRAVIVSSKGPAIFDLGQHDSFDSASAFAFAFCERKNQENHAAFEKARAELPEAQQAQLEPPGDVEPLWIFGNDDWRRFLGSMLCPFVIAKEKREAEAVEAPVRHGVEQPAED